MDLLGIKLACSASLYQLDDILEGCRPVKAMPKGFTDQRVRWCMVATLASMDLYKQLTALFSVCAPQYDAIGATPIEIPFYQHVSLSHTNNPFSGCIFIKKDVVF
jgi:hypothetical protein